jgi:hypothetical protein
VGGSVQSPHSYRGTKTKYIYSKTRKDAAAKLAKAIADRNSGVVFDCGSLTVGEYLGRWLDAVRGTVRERKNNNKPSKRCPNSGRSRQ